MTIEKEEHLDPIVDTYEYRGYEVDILLDDYGQCFYSVIDGQEYSFGTYNSIENAKADIRYIIDCTLDNPNKENQ